MSASQDDDAAEPDVLAHDDQDTVAATRPLPELDPSEQERASPEQLPTIGYVGRYALKYCIGEGGLGTVYAAHDPLLARLIAIKTMQVNLPEQDREQFNALFLNEAKAAGSLNHPHIVTVYDAGAGSQGTYIAMELLRGKDLRQLLSVGWRPTPAQAALIVRRVADALSYAHHKGVIHRDIKPANIFMVGRTQPRVLDFGIARIRQVETQTSDGLSRFGDLVGGSPYYMAPEQMRHEPVDRRADVYSLGVVLYELLTGRKPFTGNDLDEITNAVLTQPLRPPHELASDVPQALSDLVMRAMARDLVARTRSARTLSQELRDWLDGQADVALTGADGKSGKPDVRLEKAKPQAAAHATQAAGQASGAKKNALGGAQIEGAGRVRTYSMVAAALVFVLMLAGVAWWGWAPSSQDAPVAAQLPAPSPQALQPPQPFQPAPKLEPLASAPEALPVASAAAPLVASVPAVVSPPVASNTATGSTTSTVALANTATPTTTAPQAKPVPTGTVRLAISPWGRVFVGKRAMGVTPPLTQFTLPQGKHTITIRNDDFPAFSQTVEVKAGESLTVSHAF